MFKKREFHVTCCSCLQLATPPVVPLGLGSPSSPLTSSCPCDVSSVFTSWSARHGDSSISLWTEVALTTSPLSEANNILIKRQGRSQPSSSHLGATTPPRFVFLYLGESPDSRMATARSPSLQSQLGDPFCVRPVRREH